MATHKIYSGSSWVTGVNKVWTGSVWQAAMKFWDGSSWVELGAALLSVIVTPVKLLTNVNFISACYTQVKIDNDGDLYKSTNVGGYGSSYETWLDAGLNSQVWVQRVIVAGTLNADAGSGRLSCVSDRIFGIIRVTGGTKSTTINLNFYDAASGGNLLDTQQVVLLAEREIL